jgi:UDP-N-acetylmuramate--alanine ligase
MNDHSVGAMGRVRNIHFVGIGGAGMCGIAEILHNLGYSITGSDLKSSNVTSHLEELGITVNYGHKSEYVKDCDVVVVSSAVDPENPEIVTARNNRIPVIPRAEMLAEIMRFRHGIAVAGTHGKTTTTSLIASLLAEEGLDPTFVIGGQLNSIGTNARLGSGKYLVAEADESDASFLHLQPVVAVLTNIDADHLGTYKGNFSLLTDTFLDFLQRLPFYGFAVLCVDDPGVRSLMNKMTKPYITYGIDRVADYMASDINFDQTNTTFKISRQGTEKNLEIRLNLPGKHNVLNALAAITVATELGISDQSIIDSLQNFQGIARRCSVLGTIIIDGNSITVIDDYAHHPSEVRAILDAVKKGWPEFRVIVVFQPHRFTRTRDLFNEFCDVLSGIETLVLLSVYPAGEAEITGASSRDLCDAIEARGLKRPLLVMERTGVRDALQEIVQDQDILLLLGAGDIGTLGPELIRDCGIQVH